MDLSFVGGFGLTINHHQRQKGQGGGGYVRKPFTLRQEPFTLCFVPGTERVIVQPSSQECCRLMPYTDQARIASPSHFTPALTNASIAAASPDSAPGRVPRPCKSVRDHVVRLQNPARPTHATYPEISAAGPLPRERMGKSARPSGAGDNFLRGVQAAGGACGPAARGAPRRRPRGAPVWRGPRRPGLF